VRPADTAAAMLGRAALPVLLRLEPERAHALALRGLRFIRHAWRASSISPQLGVELFGHRFAHPIGLAAGFDKDGDYLDALGALGFSHIEVGTVTPRPQAGNARPRLFRIRDAHALVNRMGFNSKGADHVAQQLRASRYAGVRGISIGKNADTPLERAVDDYLECLRKLYGVADYFAINLSSPNTTRLRELQAPDALARIIDPLREERRRLEARSGKFVPLLVKISPDLDEDELAASCAEFVRSGVDGVIATNTTTQMDAFRDQPAAQHGGGLSGAPLLDKSLAAIRRLRHELGTEMPIIGVGGIMNAGDAIERLSAGANLLQLYTGFVYRGPALLAEILEAVTRASSRAPARASHGH